MNRCNHPECYKFVYLIAFWQPKHDLTRYRIKGAFNCYTAAREEIGKLNAQKEYDDCFFDIHEWEVK